MSYGVWLARCHLFYWALWKSLLFLNKCDCVAALSLTVFWSVQMLICMTLGSIDQISFFIMWPLDVIEAVIKHIHLSLLRHVTSSVICSLMPLCGSTVNIWICILNNFINSKANIPGTVDFTVLFWPVWRYCRPASVTHGMLEIAVHLQGFRPEFLWIKMFPLFCGCTVVCGDFCLFPHRCTIIGRVKHQISFSNQLLWPWGAKC